MNVYCYGVLLLFIYGKCDAVPPQSNSSIAESFYAFEVVPDVIPTPPQGLMVVRYRNSGVSIYAGGRVRIEEVYGVPYVSWNYDPNKYYTIILIDPDVPSRVDPSDGEFIHWLVVNVPGNDVASGQTKVEIVVTPPRFRIGYHRYVYLVYEQRTKLNYAAVPRISSRQYLGRFRFNTQELVEKYRLGTPIAGNLGTEDYLSECSLECLDTKK